MVQRTNYTKKTPTKGAATAPYNFVSLPQGVLVSPVEGDAASDAERIANYRRHVLAPDRISGRIDLELRTLTPVFIGEGDGKENFFAPVGTPVIPGSSIRGMVKNLFKIVTCGAMRGDGEDYNDNVLYFRTMAGKNKGMRDLYTDEMSMQTFRESGGKKVTISETKAAAGYLIQQKGDDTAYYICPAEFKVMPDKKDGSRYDTVQWGEPLSGEAACYTGKMRGKSSYTMHYAPDWQKRIPVRAAVVQAYREDITRKGVDILNESDRNGAGKICDTKQNEVAAAFTGNDDISYVVPCFYKQDDEGNVRHFGFGRFYRIPYHRSVGEHVIGMGTNAVDYADAVFGRKELWAGRLAFTDALPVGEPQMAAPAYPKVLSEPKPTSVQLYLEQKGKNGELAHWDSPNVAIRGYKLYWHQKDKTNWHNEVQENTNVTSARIQPVKAGNVFRGSIRFERLSEDELGALMKVLRLGGDDLCCKLGKGKSIGLGSVRITARLIRTDAADSYRNAFDAAGDWNVAEREEDMEAYIAAFDRQLRERLDTQVYERHRNAMAELAHMLDWDNTERPDWESKTAQMSIEDRDKPFQNRWVLPTTREVR